MEIRIVRNFILAVAAFVLILPPSLPAEDGKAPDIEILERVYDMGEVMKGEKIDYHIKVRNKGNAPLQIFDARPSCGCTVASFDKTVMPGEVGKIQATIDTNRVGNGPQTKSVTVQSNDPDEGTILLQLKANVLSLANAIPPNVFVRTDRTKMKTESFLVRPHESNPFKVTSVTSDVEYLDFDVEKVKEPENEASKKPASQWARTGDYRVTVGYKKNAPVGDLNGVITVRTDSKKTPELKVPIRGSITGLITTVPRRVFLRVTSPRMSLIAKENVKLRRTPDINAPEVGEARKGEVLEELPKPTSLDPENEWVRVRTPSRQVGYIYARFTERGEAPAVAGSGQTRTIQVRKPDGSPFKIESVKSDLDGVTVKSATIQEGRSYSLTISYDGELKRGVHQGEVRIQTSDKDEPVLKVPISVQVT